MRARTGWTTAMFLGMGFLVFLATPAAGEALAPAEAAKAARIDALLTRHSELERFNGTALVARDGRVLLAKGYGKASVELDVPNRPETRIWLGSVSKVFTAVAVMRLVDQGKISLDTTLSELLPWYRKDTGSRVTVRHLLAHTSGIPDYLHLPGLGIEGFRREVGEAPIDREAFARRWCSGDLLADPGTKWAYCNSGYFLLAMAVERATGKPFEEALRLLVLDPLGMKATGDLAAAPRGVVPGMASGYERVAGRLVTRRSWNITTAFGAGSLYSTVGDLFLLDGALETDGFLSAASRAAMFTPGAGHWGAGWEVRTLPVGPGREERTVAGHEGYLFWVLTRIYRVPADRVFVALLNNTGDVPLSAIFTGITDVLHGREPAVPKPSAAAAAQGVAASRGGEAGVARYRDLKAKEPGGWEFDERGLNTAGYALLGEGKAGAATALFRLAADEYPGSWNAWDSLGEGLAAQGRTREAIEAYERSVALNPGNANGAEQLRKLKGP